MTEMFRVSFNKKGEMIMYEEGRYLTTNGYLAWWKIEDGKLYFKHDIHDKQWYYWDQKREEGQPREHVLVDMIADYYAYKTFFEEKKCK
jgi:hypothetical protein